MTPKTKTKKVKAWAVIFARAEEGLPIVFYSQIAAEVTRANYDFPDNFKVVPCTITYETN